MVIAMAQPWKHPVTGVLYFRGRVPKDLAQKLAGQKLTLRVGSNDRTVIVRDIIKVSLGTKVTTEAKLRHAAVQAQLQERWAVARQMARTLTHEEILGLAGVAYRDLVAEQRAEPGKPEGWEAYRDLLMEPFVYLNPASDGVVSEPYDPQRGMQELSKLVDVDAFLGARGLSVDDNSRLKLMQAIAYARVQATQTLQRFAEGNYAPDPVSETYPAWQPSRPAAEVRAKGTAQVGDLINGWAKEKDPRQATLDLWRSYIGEFVTFVGHGDSAAFRRADVLAWKQKLLDDGVSPKTINDSKLASLKAVLGWAVDNGMLNENPAARVSVKRARKPGERMLGFDKADAAAILNAAQRSSSPVYRWVPFLCASSGARVAEICQLRAEDIECVENIWIMHIRAEAGPLKNVNAERKVPLHPQVIEAGFLDFVKKKQKGPLFFDPTKRGAAAKKPQSKIVAKNVANWVHKLGVEVGRKEHRKDPNHGWRHLFKTLGRDAGVQDSVLDAITGNGPPTVGRMYGETALVTAARAVAAIHLPDQAATDSP